MKWFYRAKNWVKRYVLRQVPPPRSEARTIEASEAPPVNDARRNVLSEYGRKTNEKGLNLITHFEGYYDTAYKCPANVWTIGYGTIKYPNGMAVYRGDVCNKIQARQYLSHELSQKEETIEKFLHKVGIAFNPNEFSAIVSFCYNLGTGVLTQPSRSLCKAVITGDRRKITKAMRLYVKAGGKTLRGLVRRREAEVKLFLDKDL